MHQVNIFRDPRWGRGQETPGEDPTLNGEYGSMFIAGFQGDPVAPVAGAAPPPLMQLKSSACAKHFFAYSLENCFNAHDNCRFNFDANLTQQEIEDTYLPAFQTSIQVGRVSGLMCSENAVNGVPACANHWAMTTVARDAWGFDGYVTGDCGAVDVALAPYPTSHTWPKGGNGHGYTMPSNTSIESAGLDTDCRGGGPSPALGTAADVDAALRHLWSVQIRLGRFDPLVSSPWNKLGYSSMGTSEHQQLALEAARQGIVLLKNDGQALPLRAQGELIAVVAKQHGRAVAAIATASSIAMIGPNWEVKSGGYSGSGSTGPFTLPTATYVSKYANMTDDKGHPAVLKVIPGCTDAECASDAGIEAAVAAAATADIVMVAVGIDGTFEGENNDGRALSGDIGLPGRQVELVGRVAAAAKRPIIVVLTGSSVDVTALKANSKVGAILWRGYSGEASGMALADVVFGRYNPSGRLTTTWYPQSFVTAWKPGVDPYTGATGTPPRNASFFDHHTRPNATTGNPGRTYRFYADQRAPPVYKFGAGLSYTSFGHVRNSAADIRVDAVRIQQYAEMATRRSTFRRDAEQAWIAHTVKVNVTNAGDRDGAHSLLAFAVPPGAGVDGAPLRSLIGFEKVWLEPGETKGVAVMVTAHDLTLTLPQGGRSAVRGEWIIEVGHTETKVTVA